MGKINGSSGGSSKTFITPFYLVNIISIDINYVSLIRHEKYLKSPLVRGVKLWEMLPEKVQKATTKVKFKSFVKQICKT